MQKIRVCLKCKKEKELSEYLTVTTRDLHLTCKDCYKIKYNAKRKKEELDFLCFGNLKEKQIKIIKNKPINNKIKRKKLPRKLILKRDKYQCVLCLNREELHIHHIIPISFDKSKELDIKNLVTVCVECHKKAHKYYWQELDYSIMEKLANYTHAKI